MQNSIPIRPLHLGFGGLLIVLLLVFQSPPTLANGRLTRVTNVDIASGPIAANGTLYFLTSDANYVRHLWRSDGTPAGTHLVTEIPYRPQGHSFEFLGLIGDTVLFVAYDQLWRSDGTAAGTTVIPSGTPIVNLGSSPFLPLNVASFKGAVYFAGYTEGVGTRLWRSDGTPEGTYPINVPGQGDLAFTELVVAGDTLFIAGDSVWTEDGNPRYSLYASDGTSAGTRLVATDEGNTALVRDLFAVGDLLFFTGSLYTHRWQPGLWRSDGTPEGTLRLQDTDSSYLPYYLGELDEGMLFGALRRGAPTGERELWRSDGTPEGTYLLKTIWPGLESSYPSSQTAAGRLVYFSAPDVVDVTVPWRSDGTLEGTFPLLRASDHEQLRASGSFVTAGANVYFIADEGEAGVTLWETQGSPESTRRVPELASGPGGLVYDQYQELFTFKDEVFFQAALPGEGVSLWKLTNEQTPTPTSTVTASETATASPTAEATASPTATATQTSTPTGSATSTPTSSPTRAATTATPTTTGTATATALSTPTTTTVPTAPNARRLYLPWLALPD